MKTIWGSSRQNQLNDVRPAKTQISLRIRPVWSESLVFAQWGAKDPSFLHADREDSDLMGVFAGRTCHFVSFVVLWLILCQTLHVILLYGRNKIRLRLRNIYYSI